MTPFSLVVITPRSSANSFIKVQPGSLMRRMCEMGEQSRRSPAAGNVPGTCQGLTFKCQPRRGGTATRSALTATIVLGDLDKPPVQHQRGLYLSEPFWICQCQEKKKKKYRHTHTSKKNKRTFGREKPQGKELRCSGQALEKVSILLST